MLFETQKTESFSNKLRRWYFNFIPAYRSTGAWIRFISDDWQEVHVELSLNLLTRNYVGSIFGGSIYSSLDPLYMIMIMENLGKDYVVWDKAASVRFLRPGKGKLRARFLIDNQFLDSLRKDIEVKNELDAELTVSYLNEENKVCSEVTKIIYIAKKSYYTEKKKQKNQVSDYKQVY